MAKKKKTYSRLFRQQFIETWFQTKDETTFGKHCERFGVSRQAAYEWMTKFSAAGAEGLETKSSAPHSSPHQTDEDTAQLVIDARRRHPTWGARKLKAWLETSATYELELPAASTMGDIIKRAGLVPSKKRRGTRKTPYVAPFRTVEAPNDVWTVDFKGHFATRDGRYCYPLTLADCFSRYLLRCDAYTSPSIVAKTSFEQAFVEYGMPAAIRSDNGSPFSARAIAGLSALSIWWIRLGITPERITPGSPWENGRHERMHRTLKAEATRPPQANRKQQPRAFDDFRCEFNEERPHEGIGQKTPASLYNPSKRPYPNRLPDTSYPSSHQTRIVSDAGTIGFVGRRLFLTSLLKGQLVGLCETAERQWALYFGHVLLGTLDCRTKEPKLVANSPRLSRETFGSDLGDDP